VFDISESDHARVSGNVRSFQEASWALQAGKIDTAFFVASTPARAVSDALSSGCCALLDLSGQVDSIRDAVPGLEPRDIPGRTYENQPNPVRTVGASALLVGRRDLQDEIVLEIEDAVFDNIGTLAEAHIRAEDIRLGSAFELPEGVEIHPGSVTFQEREREKLLIATGTVNGKYYHVGKRIELVLRQRGIAARAVQTGGSLENVELLADRNRHALAIVQYDVALASLWSPKLYHTAQLGDSFRIPRVKGLRRIATLHEEKLHALIRRDRIHKTARGRPTLRVLNGTRVCVGPEHSGTQVLARALLRHHGVATAESMFLSIPDMVARIHSGEIDAGFFMSHVPSEALKTVAHDGRMRLLSIDPRHVAGMLGPAVRVSTIEPGVYGAQLEDEPPVDTISTWAVLATLDDLPFDVEEITRAVFEGAAFLGISVTAADMARDLSSLPLHDRARAYYEEAGFLPSWHVDWLTVTWRSMAILVILVGGYRGLLTSRRDRTRRELSKRILSVPLSADHPHSVQDLLMIRREVRECTQKSSWKARALDQSRAAELEGLIRERMEEAKVTLKRSVLADLRALRAPEVLDKKTRRDHYASLEERIWIHLEHGELDTSQHKLLLDLIREGQQQIEGASTQGRGAEH
jgi:TRAP transporter TAXI family solute receptor